MNISVWKYKACGIIEIFFLLFVSLVVFKPPATHAVDGYGCLTCHRYPGLVKLEKSGAFKVFHVDEEKQLASPHGEVDCRECHIEVNQIPHTDLTGVDCTTRCHLEDREKIDTSKPALTMFHRDERFTITKVDDESSCRVCHPLYPHSTDHKVRAILNMHTGYLLCDVCHLKKEDIQNIMFDWKEPGHFEFTGKPYGTHEKRTVELKGEPENVITKMLKIFSKENKEGKTHRTEHLLSRIAAYSVENGQKKLLINTGDSGKAEEYMDKEKTLLSEEKANELEYFHRNIARKEVSVACNDCHAPEGILDFKQLGFNEKRVKDLEYMNIKSLVTKYDVFYLPNLFGR
jgi:hypothetical protein